MTSSEKILHADILIHDAMVLTMDKERRFIKRGSVAIVGDEIADVGDADWIAGRYRARRTIDGQNKILMPGLVNVHTHAPMTIYRGVADDIPLKEWLYDHIFPLEAKFSSNPENLKAGMRLAIAEMLLSGTTMFKDMYYFTDQLGAVVAETGMRAMLSEALFDNATPSNGGGEKTLQYIDAAIRNWKDHPLVQQAVAAHATYTVSPEFIVKAKDLARRHDTMFSVHLSENQWEVDTIREMYGATPVKHLERLHVLDRQTLAIHCVMLSDEDVDILAETSTGVAHSPQCNMKLANGAAPVPELLRRGVHVGVGTDGVASNNDLDMFDEIRTMSLLHKLSSNSTTVVSAKEAVEMATIIGAKAIGYDDKIGSLEKGKKADLILINVDKPHSKPLYNVYSSLVYSLRSSDVDTVIVNGDVLVEQRQLLKMDLSGVYEDIERIAHDISAFL